MSQHELVMEAHVHTYIVYHVHNAFDTERYTRVRYTYIYDRVRVRYTYTI